MDQAKLRHCFHSETHFWVGSKEESDYQTEAGDDTADVAKDTNDAIDGPGVHHLSVAKLKEFLVNDVFTIVSLERNLIHVERFER